MVVSTNSYPLSLPLIKRVSGSFFPFSKEAEELVAGHTSLWLRQDGVCTSILHVTSARRYQALQAPFSLRFSVGFYFSTIGFYACETHSLYIISLAPSFWGSCKPPHTTHIALYLPTMITLFLPWPNAWTPVHYWWTRKCCQGKKGEIQPGRDIFVCVKWSQRLF